MFAQLWKAVAVQACGLACAMIPETVNPGVNSGVNPGRARGPLIQTCGLSFRSPIGVAAGVDGEGRIGRRMGRLGFGFAEVGSVTRRPEAGRASLATVRANLIASQAQLTDSDRATMLGAVVAPGEGASPETAGEDVIACMAALSPFVDYVTLTVCGRRGTLRWTTADACKVMRDVAHLHSALEGKPPIWVKIPNGADCVALTQAAAALGFAAVVVENAGLDLLSRLSRLSPIVAVGGVRSREDVEARLNAGAVLVQACRTLMRWGPLAAVRLQT